MLNFQKFYENKDVDVADLQNFFLDTIFRIADTSAARRLKVGAIFVKNNSIVGIGYNHTPFDTDPSCQVQNDGQLTSKPWMSPDQEGVDGVIHAEMDCMRRMKLNNIATEGCSVYVTDSCCVDCAKELVKANIKDMFYVRPYRLNDGNDLLNSNGIPTKQVTYTKKS